MINETVPEYRYTAIYLETELIDRLEAEFNQIVIPMNGLIHFILTYVLDNNPWKRLIKTLTENRSDTISHNMYHDIKKTQVSILDKGLASKLHHMSKIAGCSVPAFIERLCASFVLLFELLDSNSMADELKRMIKSSYVKIQKTGGHPDGGDKE